MRSPSWFMAFVSLLVLAAAVSPAQAATERREVSANNEIGWRITNTSIVKVTPMARFRQGIMVDEYTVAGDATALSPETPLQKGKIRIRVNLFSPAQDMPGQKADRWYLQGTWTVTADNADPQLLRIKHNPYVVEGDIKADLLDNPAANGAMELPAQVSITNALAAGRWTNGSGEFAGNGMFEGTLRLEVDTRPDLTKLAPH